MCSKNKNCVFQRGENNEKKDKRKEDEVKRRFRRRSFNKAAEPEVQESATWKIIDSQKTKLLVRRNCVSSFSLAVIVSLVFQLLPFHSVSIRVCTPCLYLEIHITKTRAYFTCVLFIEVLDTSFLLQNMQYANELI